MLYATLEAMGQSMSPDGVTLLAGDLSELPVETVAVALRRLRYSGDRVTLHAVMRHAGIPTGDQRVQAEAALAWEEAREYGERYTEIQGENYVPGRHGRALANFAAMSERIKTTVRQIGGWSLFRLTPDEDMHWLRRRFLEQYELYEPMEYLKLTGGTHNVGELEAGLRQLAAAKKMQ
jgi:hypothetical protein